MRGFLAVLLGAVAVSVAAAADKPDLAKRHGLDADLKTFPQATPQQTLDSVIKAIEEKKADYFAAHLADPDFVDKRLKDTAGKFDDFVKEEVVPYLLKDPGTLKKLQRYLKEGEFHGAGEQGVFTLKDVPDRCVYLRRIGDRWFLENRYKPEEKK